jgi:hypothetical protein
VRLAPGTVQARRPARDCVGGPGGPGALAAYANVYRDYAHEHPGRYAAAQLKLAPETAGASAGDRHVQTARAILRGYDLAEPDHVHAVRLLGSVVHGCVSLEMRGGFSHSAPDSQETWPRILDALDALLRNWPAGSVGLGVPTGRDLPRRGARATEHARRASGQGEPRLCARARSIGVRAQPFPALDPACGSVASLESHMTSACRSGSEAVSVLLAHAGVSGCW